MSGNDYPEGAFAIPMGLRLCAIGPIPLVNPLRRFRDRLRDDLTSDACGHEEWFEQMALRQDACGFAKALDYFSERHRWRLCGELEKFEACCALVADIEVREWQRQKARINNGIITKAAHAGAGIKRQVAKVAKESEAEA